MELRNLLEYVLVIVATVMLLLIPNSLNKTQVKNQVNFWSTWSTAICIRKFFTYLGLSALFISVGLFVGVLGYHWAAGLSWLDALVEASMILSGMGPISPLLTTSAKLFASLYALFSGLIFVLAMGTVLSPLVYSLLNQLQINLKTENFDEVHHQN